ncbi:MAG: PTS glucose transporter subunit IIA [Atopobiaceae bacterium]|nr:PTS glucose transporter subunit IIA [Atopobiaceae bacterium]
MGFFDKLFGSKKSAKPETVATKAESGVVCAAVSGRVEVTADIPDPMFAGELMGRTVAVWPEAGEVFAPISGTLTAAMPHAFGIAGDDGAEALVHIGVDTVNMAGDGFTVWAEVGSHVAAGEPMVSFDKAKVKAAGHPDIVMTIVTNSDDLAGVRKVSEGNVAAGAVIMEVGV